MSDLEDGLVSAQKPLGVIRGKQRLAMCLHQSRCPLTLAQWACGTPHSENTAAPAVKFSFVFGMVKGKGGEGFGIKVGDATAGPLLTSYEGARPPGYSPMKLQGSIILGIGGDNSDSAIGSFFEGALAQGYSSDAVDEALMASVIAAGYGL